MSKPDKTAEADSTPAVAGQRRIKASGATATIATTATIAVGDRSYARATASVTATAPRAAVAVATTPTSAILPGPDTRCRPSRQGAALPRTREALTGRRPLCAGTRRTGRPA